MPTDIKLDSLIINSVDSQETYKKMEEQGFINENEIYLVDEDNSQEKITAEGILKGDGQGNITTAVPGIDYLVSAPVSSVNGKTGAVSLSASDVGAASSDLENNVVKVDTEQSFTNTQKEQARANISAANIDTQTKVFATSAKSDSVTVAAADLVSYVNSLPRMLDSVRNINVQAGTVSQTLSLNGFYGPGRLRFIGAGNDKVTLTAGIYNFGSSAPLALENFAISGLGYSAYKATVYCSSNSQLLLNECVLTGDGTNTGVYIDNNSHFTMMGGSITDCAIVVNCFSGSIASFTRVTGSNNTKGVDPYGGGLVILSGSSSANLGSSASYVSGHGLTIDCNRGLITNYGGTGTTSVGGIAYSTLGFRGSKLATADTNPGTNNTICWTYS